MGATASLSQTALTVEPGNDVSFDVTVRNTGSVVDQFTFEVLGDAARWATVDPSSLSLFPGAEGSARVRISPPRTAEVQRGEVPFAVKVSSREDPTGSVVEEGVLTVGGYLDLSLELLPRTGRGRRYARFDVAIDNRGNDRINAVLDAADPDGKLRFGFDPPGVVAEPGAAVFSTVTVRPMKTFWRGQPVTLPFEVVAAPDGQAPLVTQGTLLQEARLPKWFWKAVLAALLLALLLVILWFTVLKPSVESAARDAVAEPLRQTEAAIQDLARQVGATEPTIDVPGEGEDPNAVPITTELGSPFDRRLAVDAGGNSEASFDVPDDQFFSLTDLVLQNPAGDSGILRIRRGDNVLFVTNLSNFRDLDYHFVSPVIARPGTKIILAVECANPGSNCTAAAHFSGFMKKQA